MKFSTRGRYALRMMLDLAAEQREGYVSLRDISKRQDISVKYLEQIVSQLVKAGLLKTSRGPQGGYRLTKSPEEFTVGEVLRAAEGSLAPISCLDDEENSCPRCDECRSLAFWEGLNKVVGDYVDGVSLSALL